MRRKEQRFARFTGDSHNQRDSKLLQTLDETPWTKKKKQQSNIGNFYKQFTIIPAGQQFWMSLMVFVLKLHLP